MKGMVIYGKIAFKTNKKRFTKRAPTILRVPALIFGRFSRGLGYINREEEGSAASR